jgi:tRNA A-37 threonylcarbamoyl transferase component Bud32
MSLVSLSVILAQASEPGLRVTWWLGVVGLVALLFLAILVISLTVGWLFARRVPALVPQDSPAQPSPIKRLPAPEPKASSCPVCGAELPGDTPEGLCPQCLMQCALSHSDHGLPEEEERATTGYRDLPTAPTPADLAPHFPELEILELLGQGGMGAVYKTRQRKLDRLVAIKVLPQEWGRDPAFAERFGREARALARLNHPQIVSVHDFGEVDGHYFLIMEFVDGVNLRQLLTTGRLQPRQALAIVGQVCDALQYAHEQGVVHRDIKPENILLDRHGRVKIADFGLAKLLRRSRSEFTLTGSRQVMGTLDYMAPEQRSSPQSVDHRADIYSLGVVFYEMLTGELPLGRFAPPSQKAAVDGRLDEVIFRALETEPDRRYQRISAVKAEVDSILRAGAWTPGPTESPQPTEPDLAPVQIQTRGPAAGLFVMAILGFIHGVIAIPLAEEVFRNDDAVLVLLFGLFLVLIGLVVFGAIKLARCEGYEWVMSAIILVMLPLGYHFFIGFPIGCWALAVLRRPEVKAAFAVNLRRAQRATQEPANFPVPPPTGRGRHPVRAFFRSVLSMFVSQPPISRLTATGEAAFLSTPPGQLSPEPARLVDPAVGVRKRKRWGLWLGIGVASCLVIPLSIHALLGGFNKPKAVSFRMPIGTTTETPFDAILVGDIDDLKRTLPLYNDQPEVLKMIFRRAEQEYLEMELRHTSRTVNNRAERHLLVTIRPFPEELSQLEERVWAKLNAIFTYYNQPGAAQKQLPARGMLFPFGDSNATIEMWQEGSWYYWKVIRDAETHEEGNGAQLPRRYQRFWQSGPP